MSESDLCLKELGFDSKTWPVTGIPEVRPFPERVWAILRKLNLRRLNAFENEDLTPLQRFIETPMCQGACTVWESDKIEKLCFWWLRMAKRMISAAVLATPKDNYDFPALLVDWDEARGPGHFMCDLQPLTDLVINEWYRQKYMDGIDPIYRKYYDLVGPPSLHTWFRTITGPYYIFGRPQTAEERMRPLNCVLEYISFWTDMVLKAEPIDDPRLYLHLEYVKMRKKKWREWLRYRDPVEAVIMRTCGPELGKKIMISLA
jgi:hypothetical protein